MKHGKKYNDSAKLIETGKFYDTEEAVLSLIHISEPTRH